MNTTTHAPTMQELEQIKSRIQTIDPNALTTEQFLELVGILDNKLTRTAETENINREIFQMSDKLLIEFSKSSSSWETVFAVLNISDLTDAQYFQASNIFKNKLKIDFVTLKYQGGADMGTKIRDKLF